MSLFVVNRMLAKVRIGSNDRRKNFSSPDGSLTDPIGLLHEDLFLRTLCLERKRAERSRKLFVLTLLDRGASVPNGGEPDWLHRMVSAILSSIRETDIAGWYKTPSVLGIIFAELGVADRQSILDVLHAKVTAALRSTVAAEVLKDIDISFHCFPADREEWKAGFQAHTKLYPDLARPDRGTSASLMIKRTIDVLGSSLALLVLAPVFLAIAVAIKLSSPGPILFRQERIGQYGVPFTCLKFRSMHVLNDPQIHMEYVTRLIAGTLKSSPVQADRGGIFKITNDPRVTRVGRLLRRMSLDELPQFLNVLRGEMSLVGPRPPLLYEIEAYDIWHRRRVLEVKPGITGLWQVNGRSRVPFEEMVRLDLKYARAWSLGLDLKILLQTARAVLSGDGSY